MWGTDECGIKTKAIKRSRRKSRTDHQGPAHEWREKAKKREKREKVNLVRKRLITEPVIQIMQ